MANEKRKIVVLDGYTTNPGDLSWDSLAALGDLTVYDRTSQTDEQEVIDKIGDAEIVYTKKVPIRLMPKREVYQYAGDRIQHNRRRPRERKGNPRS